MVSADLSEDFEDLNSEFSSRRDNEGTETIEFGPLSTVELLENGDKESECLSASCLGSTHDIFALEGERNGSSLNIGKGLKMRGLEAGSGRDGERELREVLDFL